MMNAPRLAACAVLFPLLVATADLPKPQVDQAAQKLAEDAKKELAQTGIPAIAVAVVFDGKVILAEGFGVREAGTDHAVDADTVFQLASLSKPMASTVVAALVGKGVVDWNSRISDLDPAFEMFTPWVTREVTLRDLFSHRSGLPDHAGDFLEDLGYPRSEILHRLRFQPPDSSFRSAFAYTNFGLTEAATAAARAFGKDWETTSEELVYKPLGMRSTSSRFSDFEKHENRALGHRMIDGKWVHREQREPDAQSPAGGVSSTLGDMTKWMQLQIDGGDLDGTQIVEPAALAETHQPVILTGFSPIDGTPGFYGLGWNVRYDTAGRLRFSHSGAFDMGAATFVGIVPSEQLGVLILTNASPIGVPEGLGEAFLERALTGRVETDWMPLIKGKFEQMAQAEKSKLPDEPPADPLPAARPDVYVGTYSNDFFGPARVVEKDGGLAMELGPKPLVFPLTHWNGDMFTYEPTGEMAAGRSAVSFLVGPDGNASRLWIENLDGSGMGTFNRIVEE